jgi:hypothetical protein
VLSEPLKFSLPVQAPEALHAVAFVELHVNTAALPLLSVAGEAVRVTVGAASATVTLTLCAVEPPDPVQVNVKLVVAVSGLVDNMPLNACEPLQPPDAVQVCALEEFQSKTVDWPRATLVGFD